MWSCFKILVSVFALTGFSLAKNMTTVPELNLDAYSGHWFQVYAAPFDYVFQGYGKCITADYAILGPNNVSVLNSQLAENGTSEAISGYAFYKDETKPGQLSVSLQGVPFDAAPYWVFQLGPLKNSKYEYSIISVPIGPSLWVLARDVEEFFILYREEVSNYLDANNYTYVVVEQGC